LLLLLAIVPRLPPYLVWAAAWQSWQSVHDFYLPNQPESLSYPRTVDRRCSKTANGDAELFFGEGWLDWQGWRLMQCGKNQLPCVVSHSFDLFPEVSLHTHVAKYAMILARCIKRLSGNDAVTGVVMGPCAKATEHLA
jgi:hypothetical protein